MKNMFNWIDTVLRSLGLKRFCHKWQIFELLTNFGMSLFLEIWWSHWDFHQTPIEFEKYVLLHSVILDLESDHRIAYIEVLDTAEDFSRHLSIEIDRLRPDLFHLDDVQTIH